MKRTPLPAVDPMPPRASGILPWIGAGIPLLYDPTAAFRRWRRRLGDTFVVDAFGYRLVCLFSPAGVRAFYELPERTASKGFADYQLLRHKVPDELFAGRRNFPHHLFGNQDTETYLDNLELAVALQLGELGSAGRLEVFAYTRRLGHRLGLASWAGLETAGSAEFERIVALLDTLDASESFVRPASGLVAWASGKRREQSAMTELESILGRIVAARGRAGANGDFLDRITDSWSDVTDEHERAVGIARDVMLIHMGSQSNLYAAMAWTLVNLLLRPQLLEQVLAGDDVLLEQCANESIRLAQRSLTLRSVLQPLDINNGARTYRVEPGAFVATMLSVTNTTAIPALEGFDPSRYEGRRLRTDLGLPARELVSTFGHGRHSCPAQRFAISAIRISLRRLLEGYRLEPRFHHARPLRGQIGGVARAASRCIVDYRRRS